jgi:hypothetical protein
VDASGCMGSMVVKPEASYPNMNCYLVKQACLLENSRSGKGWMESGVDCEDSIVLLLGGLIPLEGGEL